MALADRHHRSAEAADTLGSRPGAGCSRRARLGQRRGGTTSRTHPRAARTPAASALSSLLRRSRLLVDCRVAWHSERDCRRDLDRGSFDAAAKAPGGTDMTDGDRGVAELLDRAYPAATRPGGDGVVEHALAAVGPGPVVHVRVRVHPQGTAVDLATGRRARVYAVIEQWYEPGVGLFQRVVRSNGGLEPGSLPLTRGVFPAYAAALQGFGSGYRDALQRREARIVSKATLRSSSTLGRRLARVPCPSRAKRTRGCGVAA